ncbi:MAG: SdpI family protein [Parvimonas sp.]|nr:SdpI family protein [Parvimonas sp.]
MIYIVAIVFISGGIIMKAFPPKFDSGIYGFRTKKSSRNKGNWVIAQKKSSNYIIFFGIFDFVLTFINDTFVKNNLYYDLQGLLVIIYSILIYILVQKNLK